MANDNTTDYKTLKTEVDSVKDSINNLAGATDRGGSSLGKYLEYVKDTGIAFQNMLGDLKSVATHLDNSHIIAQRTADTFGLLGNAALGASKMFKEGFQDTSGLQSFGEQLNDFFATADKLEDPFRAISNVAVSMGIPFAGAMRKSGETLDTFKDRIHKTLNAITEGPDATLKFEHAFLQMSAAAGGLGKVFANTGGDLRNINGLLQTQSQVLKDAVAATGADTKSVQEYYFALGRIPGFLNEQVSATDEAGLHLNMLTATMKLAHGTGQDEAAVMQDVATAFNNYGASGEKALEFTARISDLSQKYGVQLSDVRSYMNQTSEAFKFLGENIDSSADVFESYFSRLKQTGLSSQAAAQMTGGLSRSIADMTIAQKAFLSGQTGGPGGLMGAVQIEKDIRDHKYGDVMKRVESALKQQFGRIVTQQEAATSEQAAAQFVKQRMFLQQGPFGSLVKGEGEATRLLEAFAKPGGVTGGDAQKILTDSIKHGSDVEHQSQTVLTHVNANTESIKMLSGITAFGVTKLVATASSNNKDVSNVLMGGIRDAMEHGYEATKAGSNKAVDRSALYMTQGVQNIYKALDMSKATVNAMGQEASSLINSQQTMIAQHQNEYNKAVNQSRRGAGVGTAAHNAANMPTSKTTHDIMLEQFRDGGKTKTAATTPPQNITITMTNVCPDCHKKFVTNQNVKSVNNSPEMYGSGPGPGF